MIDQEIIEKFLKGRDPEEYIVSLEYDFRDNKIHRIIQDPIRGKIIKPDTFTPFCWVGNMDNKNFYKNDKSAQKKAMRDNGIVATKLRTDGNERLENGLKFLVKSMKSYSNLVNFFKQGGIDPWDRNHSDCIKILTPVEQYLIITGKRLFKGMEEYGDVLRMVFDIETTSLHPTDGMIFLMGIKDNKGFERVLSASNDEEEAKLIKDFFDIIKELKPTIIGGYNSSAFDFPFVMKRAELLGLNVREFTEMLKAGEYLKIRPGILKLGGEVEDYNQYKLWGFNVLDIAHSVRRTQAINSEIKSWGLKYITKFIEKEKPNRVYVDGGKIYSTFFENKQYYMNPKTGKYKEIGSPGTEDLTTKFPGKYEIWTGQKIVNQYLLDDLYETMVVDDAFNQATFMMSKLLPSTYERAATMGTAAPWKLIMYTWSYDNGLAIPAKGVKRDFTGGLSRLVKLGYSKNVVKFDFSSLYPSIQLVYDIFPECDITAAMKSMLGYFRTNRIFYKRESERLKDSDKILSEAYNRKQLPIKIFINGFFGSVSAPEAFEWADIDMGERITCAGRQFLRMMIMFFMKKGYNPIVGDTDGFNFTYPEEAVVNVTYTGKGLNELVEEGKVYTGVEAHVAEFNDSLMRNEMGLDIDYYAPAQINFARKNYAILNKKNKVKLTGNSIKSKKIPTYIEEFLDKGIRLLLEGKGCDFIEEYYSYVQQIYDKKIPLAKIANKARVKQSVRDYKKYVTKTTKAGNAMSRQAHMELILQDNYPANLGETIYYVNNGERKSHGDVIKKEDGIKLNCYMLTEAVIAKDPTICGDYNVPRYLNAFNKRLEILLVCFHPDIRDNILVTDPAKRGYFTNNQCELVAGFAPEPDKQDDLEKDVLTMEESELTFWKKTRLDPHYMYLPGTTELVDKKWIEHNHKLVYEN